MQKMAEMASPRIEKEIIDAAEHNLRESVLEFLKYMKQFMKQNFLDPKVQEKLNVISDAELQPSTLDQFFLGSYVSGFASWLGLYTVSTGATGASTVMTIAAGYAAFSLTAVMVLAGGAFLAYKSHWDYETSLVKLKEKMSQKFNDVIKYMIHTTFMRAYEKMVEECERHN